METVMCRVDDIPEGGMKYFEIVGNDLVVARVDGKFYCMDAACTVSWAMLTDGTLNPANRTVTCPECKSSFSLETGEPTSGPAKFPVTVYEAHVIGDEVIVNLTY